MVKTDTDKLIASLTDDLQPVSTPLPAWIATVGWLALAWTWVVGVTIALGPMREGWLSQLLSTPQFALEFALGASAIVAASYAALQLSTPSQRTVRRSLAPAFALLTAWVALLVYGLFDPALAPSMAGKRPHCFVETLAFSVVPIAMGLVFVRRRAALDRKAVALLFGLGAAAIPALIMQAACMYDPQHALMVHLGPVAIIGVLSGLLVSRFIPKL